MVSIYLSGMADLRPRFAGLGATELGAARLRAEARGAFSAGCDGIVAMSRAGQQSTQLSSQSENGQGSTPPLDLSEDVVMGSGGSA